jgi:colicin import membrane protein
VYYTETDFYRLRREADQGWRWSVALAISVHVAVALLVMYTPSLFPTESIVEDVVSVSLVAMPEPGGAVAPPSASEAAPPASPPAAKEKVEPPPPPPEVKTPPKTVEPVEVPKPTPKEKVSVAETPPPEPVAAKDPISLAPDKRKIKKTQDTRLDEEKINVSKQEDQDLKKKLEKLQEYKRELDRKEQQQRDDAQKKAAEQTKREQLKAEAEARAAAEDARKLAAQSKAAADALAAVTADAGRRTQAVQNAAAHGGAVGRQQAQSLVEQNYWNEVAQRIKAIWVLPETRKWNAGLLALVKISINKNGDVTKIQFDQHSNDPIFDQLVEKTIKSAAPMPRFPPVMQQETTEGGLRFRPGDLGNM